VNLPYSENISYFEDGYKEILKSDSIGKENKNYLEAKWKEKQKWAKCFMKTKFCVGMCTSSRIEAKHRLLKRYLNSSKGLVYLFSILRDIEKTELKNFQDEVTRISEKENKQYEKTEIIKCFQGYSDYALNKLKQQLIESNNYKIKSSGQTSW